MTLPFAAGDDLTATLLNTVSEASGWQTYTPTWASSGTAPAVGNGTLKGSYCVVGKLVFTRINQQMGSTTTYGTGGYNWSLPPGLTAATVTGFSTLPIWTGSAMCLDSGTAYKLGVLSVASGGTSVTVLENTGGGQWGQLVPQTWTTNDYLAFNFVYEKA